MLSISEPHQSECDIETPLRQLLGEHSGLLRPAHVKSLVSKGYRGIELLELASRESLVAALGADNRELIDILLQKVTKPPSGDVNATCVAAFKDSLNRGGIKQIDSDILWRVAGLYPLRMFEDADAPAAAAELYRAVAELPGTATCATIEQYYDIQIIGAWRGREYMQTAVDKATGALLLVNVLPANDSRPAMAVQSAISKLQLRSDSGLSIVPAEVFTLHPDPSRPEVDAAPRTAIKMPLMACDLAGLPQLTEQLICAGVQQLRSAVEYIHSKKLVHMNIKPANVLLDTKGRWYLSDFGSCTPVGERVWSYTQFMYAGAEIYGQPAEAKHDWRMVVVLVAMLLDKANISKLKATRDAVSVQLELVLQRCHAVQLPELKQLVRELVRSAGWQRVE